MPNPINKTSYNSPNNPTTNKTEDESNEKSRKTAFIAGNIMAGTTAVLGSGLIITLVAKAVAFTLIQTPGPLMIVFWLCMLAFCVTILWKSVEMQLRLTADYAPPYKPLSDRQVVVDETVKSQKAV